MKTFEECQKHEKYSKIKKSTIDTINDYVKLGLTPGGFVKAVLSNDLMRSFGLADDEIENRFLRYVPTFTMKYLHLVMEATKSR